MEEYPIVVMDDEFLERFGKNFAEKATPVYQQMMNEKIRENMKYTYYACWASGMLGMLFTMIVTNMILGVY
ncbi:hypothetical protein CMK18_21625 [Candidatus Poribacteria bacterium]|nr:hypothetical protein [Candidatus Poribacteria bacterium]|tara:strand:+ start:198 stop:410 length:213 start_codon:yes stop_codon:yes gene_type:complete